MNLAACRSVRRRQDFVMRLGCFLVTFAVLASLVLEPPRAKAFAMTSSAVTALAGGFLSACGLTPVVSGMGSSEEVNESVARLIQDFLNEEVGGISVADWALSFGEIGLAVKDKRIVIPKPFAEKLGQFAQWVAGKYGTKPGVNQVYRETSSYITLQDGTKFFLSECRLIDGKYRLTSVGSTFRVPSDLPLCFSSGISLEIGTHLSNGKTAFGYSFPGGTFSTITTTTQPYTVAICQNYVFRFSDFEDASTIWYLGSSIENYFGNLVYSDEFLSLEVSDTMQEVLDRLTALEEGQSIALDVGATQSMEIQDILQGILDAILAGDLAASAEIVDTAEVPVDPEEPDPPVVPVVPSGLDKLGAALISRFPFSIPWDVYKGVTLLAAPPKAPYFEVDFMAPIADRVGGWKGSTKIVLDFSEYEIIGQVCRWTSTIGFCLMLASGTKRLIWTA